jgi:hypothetical protein
MKKVSELRAERGILVEKMEALVNGASVLSADETKAFDDAAAAVADGAGQHESSRQRLKQNLDQSSHTIRARAPQRHEHLWLGISQTTMRRIPSSAVQVQPIDVTTVLGLAGWGCRQDPVAEPQ